LDAQTHRNDSDFHAERPAVGQVPATQAPYLPLSSFDTKREKTIHERAHNDSVKDYKRLIS
jgi:hypothetical protein